MEAVVRRHLMWIPISVVATIVLATGAAAAQNLSRLPADITLAQSGDSPGKVTFSHASHVSYQAKPDCTVCHPRLAPIVKAAKGTRRAAITHAAMLKGQACGACHGKDAHNFDDCTTCHK
jgi:c(7)-type cytochrome triheme protein